MTALPGERKILIFEDQRYILFFAIISAIFSFVESVMPRPFIFIKIGLAYIPILLIIDKIKTINILLVILLKSIITGFFSGTLFSFTGLLSIIGSFGSIFAYLLIKPFLSEISKVAISIWLSIFTNLFQIVFYGFFIIKDINLFKLVPIFNLISVLTGFFTALIAIQIENRYLEIKFIS